jgi:hypothetical protein
MENQYTYKYSDVEGMICDLKNLMPTIHMYTNLLNFFLAIAHQSKNIKGRKKKKQVPELLERV